MKAKLIDRNGKRYGRWKVLRQGKIKNGHVTWLCECDCGTIREVLGKNLGRSSKSCGCLQQELLRKRKLTHGMSYSKFYSRWQNMLQRCNTPTHKQYPHYGGRGIRACSRWSDFKEFKKDMYLSYCIHKYFWGDNTTLDRIDNDKGYNPHNCRWTTWEVQASNRKPPLTARRVARIYILWRTKMIKCRQRHFVLSCIRCKKYEGICKLYSKYVESWVRLQHLVKE